MEASIKNYMGLTNANFEVKLTLTALTGTDFACTANGSTGKLPLHALMRSLTVTIADKLVPKSNNLYSYRGLFERQPYYPAELMKTRVKCEGVSSRRKAISGPLCTLRVHYMLMRSSIVL